MSRHISLQQNILFDLEIMVFFFSEIDGDGFALFSLTKDVNVLSVLVEE